MYDDTYIPTSPIISFFFISKVHGIRFGKKWNIYLSFVKKIGILKEKLFTAQKSVWAVFKILCIMEIC